MKSLGKFLSLAALLGVLVFAPGVASADGGRGKHRGWSRDQHHEVQRHHRGGHGYRKHRKHHGHHGYRDVVVVHEPAPVYYVEQAPRRVIHRPQPVVYYEPAPVVIQEVPVYYHPPAPAVSLTIDRHGASLGVNLPALLFGH